MLSCNQVQRLLSDALDGELPPLTRLRLRLHLALCRPCAAVRDSLERTVNCLNALRDDEELKHEDG